MYLLLYITERWLGEILEILFVSALLLLQLFPTHRGLGIGRVHCDLLEGRVETSEDCLPTGSLTRCGFFGMQ